MARKKKLTSESMVAIPTNFDVTIGLNQAKFAQITGNHSGNIPHLIKSGKVQKRPDVKIYLKDNILYLIEKLTDELVLMNVEQKERSMNLLAELQVIPRQGKPQAQGIKEKQQKPKKAIRLDKFKTVKPEIFYTAYLFEDENYIPIIEFIIFEKDPDDSEDQRCVSITGIAPSYGIEVNQDNTLIFHFQGEAFSSKEIFLKEQSYFSV